jgi:hypothetical protein
VLRYAYGPDDTLHGLFSLRKSGTAEAWVATWDGAAWVEEFTDFTMSDDTVSHYDLAVDGAGQPHAIFESSTELWYVGVRGGSWTTSLLDDPVEGAHVFLDTSDAPWACWYDNDPDSRLPCAH